VKDIEKSEWGGSEDMQEDLGQIQRNLWKILRLPGNVQSDQEGMQENLEKIQEDLGMEDPIKGN
jgi:hypothetical protein